MIDAPDHAAQEQGNRSGRGMAPCRSAGDSALGCCRHDELRLHDGPSRAALCRRRRLRGDAEPSYDAFNSAYTTKNLIRVMEIAGEAARDMERDGSVDNAMLEQYADQFNVKRADRDGRIGQFGVRVLNGRCGLRVARYVSQRITRAGGGNSSA